MGGRGAGGGGARLAFPPLHAGTLLPRRSPRGLTSGMPVTWMAEVMPLTMRVAEMRYCCMVVACCAVREGSLKALTPSR